MLRGELISSGQGISFVDKGDTLYDVTKAFGGDTIQISVERASGVPLEAS
jgi:hypothetical protein